MGQPVTMTNGWMILLFTCSFIFTSTLQDNNFNFESENTALFGSSVSSHETAPQDRTINLVDKSDESTLYGYVYQYLQIFKRDLTNVLSYFNSEPESSGQTRSKRDTNPLPLELVKSVSRNVNVEINDDDGGDDDDDGHFPYNLFGDEGYANIDRYKRESTSEPETEEEEGSTDEPDDPPSSVSVPSTTSAIDPSPKSYFRVLIPILQKYNPEILDHTTEEYEEYASNINATINEIFKAPNFVESTLSGVLDSTDVKISKLVVDLVISGKDNTENIRSKFASAMKNGVFGNYRVKSDSFIVNNFGTTLTSCESDLLPCLENNECYRVGLRCDKSNDCPDSSDELDCPESVSSNCRSDGKYDCKRRDETDELKQICAFEKCDGKLDCPEGDDEWDCLGTNGTSSPPTTTNTTALLCPTDQFQCDNGECIDEDFKCDGRIDCSDSSDETECPRRCSSPTDFLCGSGECIRKNQTCDKNVDCKDYSDEFNCKICSDNEFQCDTDRCIPISFKCNGRGDCLDNTDEDGCPSNRTCGTGQFQCNDGFCIPDNSHCNNIPECPDGSDELICPRPIPTTPTTTPITQTPFTYYCQEDQFTCKIRTQCIPSSYRCDGKLDCYDRSDEDECPTPPTTTPPIPSRCQDNEFLCKYIPMCISSWNRCDGKPDCFDRSDEENCALKLHVSPHPGQIIREKQEVVFQCRDESSIRANITWERAGGLPLPAGYRILPHGRLEIPDIQLNHAGTYICRAEDKYYNYPGSRVEVNLIVEPDKIRTTTPPARCRLDEHTCRNGECIPKDKVCDRQIDCSDRSDEERCSAGPSGCEPNQFQCENKKCIQLTWVCDSEDDCGDRSDEVCPPNPPGSVCRSDEFLCPNSTQCIPKSLQCDRDIDCPGGTDEFGCIGVTIITPPQRDVSLTIGETLWLTCKTFGVPTPEVIWRLNWGHVPRKCYSTSVNGFGTLTCPNMQIEDSGAYSCESMNNRGSTFASHDAIVIVRPAPNICRLGQFNDLANSTNECINCFCFGATTECKSANLFVQQIPPAVQQFRIESVLFDRRVSKIEVKKGDEYNVIAPIEPLSADSFRVRIIAIERYNLQNIYPYLSLPASYLGNQLKSYGGYISYLVSYVDDGPPLHDPDIIIQGNGLTLVHGGIPFVPNTDTQIRVRLFYGNWFHGDASNDIDPSRGTPATREELMMVLANLEYVLIKIQFTAARRIDVTFRNFQFDSAGKPNNGLGPAYYVEECSCPPGYSGLSCENCASGHMRSREGRWLGSCQLISTPVPCSPGFYGDPRNGIPCRPCPCPHTSPGHQFMSSCSLSSDGSPVCACLPGYEGRNCEFCSSGFVGNPTAGVPCIRSPCNPAGSITSQSDPVTGACVCKRNVVGRLCNQCKANTFHLATTNANGCISCFCMGHTTECTNARLYREQIISTFVRDSEEFVIGKRREVERNSISNLTVNNGEIVYNLPAPYELNVFYWALPNKYLNDKVTSYGGYLNYTLRFTPTPGAQSSRNSAPDVEIISANSIRLLFYKRGDPLEADTYQTVSVPLLEQYWQREDGQIANREHLLMALANLKAIVIKASQSTTTQEVALRSVVMDTAEERNTGLQAAMEVEECRCPVGYTGYSCERCDAGYYRDLKGLYLATCEPCQCNGFSSECDPETGDCINCLSNTAGRRCENCKENYVGNPSKGEQCRPESTPGSISGCCDERGSLEMTCNVDGKCSKCKANVFGDRCDTCKPGTFDLQPFHENGCLDCYCSGVSRDCLSSNFYVTQIPTPVLSQNHGFILTNRYRTQVINSGLRVDPSQNRISYDYTTERSQQLFWSLPSQLTGNRLTSYGGFLKWTQEYQAPYDASSRSDTNLIIIGSGISIFWTSDETYPPNTLIPYSVKLVENGFRRVTDSGTQRATRPDMLRVLSNVEAILIQATYASQTSLVSISDVILDSASGSTPSGPLIRALEVERCTCPIGYKGLSCESCENGFYPIVDSEGFKCEKGSRVQITPVFIKKPIGSIVNVTCISESPYKFKFIFKKDFASRKEIFNDTNKVILSYTLETSNWSGQQTFTFTIEKDLRSVICDVIHDVEGSFLGSISALIKPGFVSYLIQEVTKSSMLVVRGSETIVMLFKEPLTPTVAVGDYVQFTCLARSLANRTVTIYWSKEGGSLPVGRSIDDGSGILTLISVNADDSGTYVCRAYDDITNNSLSLNIIVGDSRRKPEAIVIPSPENSILIVRTGGFISINCEGRGLPTPNMEFGRIGSSETRKVGVGSVSFTVEAASRTEEGIYYCRASNEHGVGSQQFRIQIVDKPNVIVSPPIPNNILEVTVGERLTIRCEGNGIPEPNMEFGRILTSPEEDSYRRVGVRSVVFDITSVSQSHEGNYYCRASNEHGVEGREFVIRVNERVTSSPPARLVIQPSEYSAEPGATVRFQCSTTFPLRFRFEWSRAGNLSLPRTAIDLEGGVLVFTDVTPADAGTYICRAYDLKTGIVVESEAFLRVLNIDQGSQRAPSVSIDPERQTVPQGTPATLRCMSSDPTARITWEKHNGEMTNGVQIRDFELRIATTQVKDRGVYICRAANRYGSGRATSILEIERREPPAIELYPSDKLSVIAGNEVMIQCKVNGGIPAPSIRWHKPSRNDRISPRVQEINGVLKFTGVTAEDEGEYICSAENAAGSVDAIAYLEVNTYPTVNIYPAETVYNVYEGDRINIQCISRGKPHPDVLWKHSAYPDRTAYSQINSSAYAIPSVRLSDSGILTCVASNAAGQDSKSIQIVVKPSKPSGRGDYNDSNIVPSRAPDDEYIFPQGSTATLRCGVAEDDRLTLHWTRAAQSLPARSDVRNGVLTIYGVDKSDEGKYSCVVRGPRGEVAVQTTIILRVTVPPQISLNPLRQVVRPGDNVYVSCTATGDQPILIYWSPATGRPLPKTVSVDRGLLQFRGITIFDAGKYICRAQNSAGEATEVAEVIVNDVVIPSKPIISAGDHNMFGLEGSDMDLKCTVSSQSLDYQVTWSRESSTLPRNAQYFGSTLKLNSLKAYDSGRYICSVTSPYGSNSDYIDLLVERTCYPDEFRCEDGNCIMSSQYCDFKQDCRDNSDEENCHYHRRGINNTIIPKYAKAGDSFYLTCDSFGSSNTLVQWTKVGGEFESNVRTEGNVLRIDDVRIENFGLYRCSVEGEKTHHDYSLQIEVSDYTSAAIIFRSVKYGENVDLPCLINSDSAVNYSWVIHSYEKSLRKIANNTQTLHIPHVTANNSGLYFCVAANKQGIVNIPTMLTVENVIPSFNKDSYMAVPPLLETSVDFNIEITFKPKDFDGLLLYTGENKNGKGDYLAFGLHAGIPEFRFNPGGGPAIITGRKPLSLNQWYTIKLIYYQNNGFMEVEGYNYTGTAPGRFRKLDLKLPLFVGGMASFNALTETGFDNGFAGCISKLTVDSREIDLKGNEVIHDENIGSCNNCKENRCENNGVCQETRTATGFTCICPPGFSGDYCDLARNTCYLDTCGDGLCIETESGTECQCPFGKAGKNCRENVSIKVAAFKKNSFLAYSNLLLLRKKLHLSMNIKPRGSTDVDDGVVAYVAEKQDGTGDFVGIYIINSFIELKGKIMSMPISVRSNTQLVPNEYVNLTMSLNQSLVELRVGSEAMLVEEFNPTDEMTELKLHTPLYIGGFDNTEIILPKILTVRSGFTGCISSVEFSNEDIRMLETHTNASNVHDCFSSFGDICLTEKPCLNGGSCSTTRDSFRCSCAMNFSGEKCEIRDDICEKLKPCKNGGICRATDKESYICACPLGFVGPLCDTKTSIEDTARFNGTGYIELSPSLFSHEKNDEVIEIEFTTNDTDGLIFWQGSYTNRRLETDDDYFGVAIVNGIVQLSVSTNKTRSKDLKASHQRVNDNKPHSVRISKSGNQMALELDATTTDYIEIEGSLKPKGHIFVGGLPNIRIMTSNKFRDNFNGCVQRLKINNPEIINFGMKALSAANASPCKPPQLKENEIEVVEEIHSE